MNAQPIKNILLIFAIGLGRVKRLRNFMTACRKVVHRMRMLATQCGQAIKGGANRWLFLAGVGEVRITVSRRVGFVLLVLGIFGTPSIAHSAVTPPTPGLTIITHGYQRIGGTLPDWVDVMAHAIKAKAGADIPIYQVLYDKGSFGTADDVIRLCDLRSGPCWVQYLFSAGSIDITSTGGAIVLLDWAGVSDETVQYPAQNVADRFFNYLFGQGHNGHNLAELPIHLIGHSRGTSLNSRLAYRLAEHGILVDHVTTLDPHPTTLTMTDDEIPVTYDNVIFADNYFRTGAIPDGRFIAGTRPDNLSDVITGIFTDPITGHNCTEHAQVHTYYHGTIDWSASTDGDCSIQLIWYDQPFRERSNNGYSFSRYESTILHGAIYGGRPASGLHQLLAKPDGTGNRGTGSRVSVNTANQFWPNVGFNQSDFPAAARATVGQPVSIPYYYADRSSQQTIKFFTDIDTNPFDGVVRIIGSVPQGSRPAGGSIGATTYSWTPTAADVGTRYIGAVATNTLTDFTRARYDYYLKPIIVDPAPIPTPTINSVFPLSLNTQSSGIQTLTIFGTGFTPTSTVNFKFLSGTGPVNVTELSQPRFISSTELKYDISPSASAGTYTVTVSNGAATSQPQTFNVVTPLAVATAPAAPIGLNSFSGNWSKLNQFTLDWTNPASAAGISKVWWKIGAAPTSSVDGNVLPLNSAKPLQISLQVIEGQQDVHVWLEDGAGNRSHLNRATIRLGKDVTPPGVAITSQLAATTTQTSVTLSGTFGDALSGVSRVTWTNNNLSSGDVPITPGLSGSWTTQPITLYGGDNYITVTAIDAAGNYTTSAVTINKTDTTNSGSITATISPAGAITAGAQWRVNYGAWHSSGETELNVPAGTAYVAFMPIYGWITPMPYWVNVIAGQISPITASYQPAVTNAAPYVPGNPFPANGASNLKRTQLAFSWTGGDPDGPVQYALDFSTNPNPTAYFGWGDITGTSAQIPFTLQPATTYYWRVLARDGSGAITQSPVWRFTTKYSTPDLIVSNVVLNGNVAPGASVTADVTVQNIGSFTGGYGFYMRLYLSKMPGAKENYLTPSVSYFVPNDLQPNATYTFSIPVALNGLQAGQSYIDAWVDPSSGGTAADGNINNNTRSIPISYLDGQAPSVTFAGLQNAFVKTGIASTITYIATDDTGIRTVDFYYSVDDGVTWVPIEEGYAPPVSPAYGVAYQWTIPANMPIVSNLKIRVVARDVSGNAGELIAGPYVVHDGTIPTVAVVSPNGGEVLPMGSVQQIRWNLTSANAIAGIQLYFYHDGTVDGVSDISGAGNGTFSWTLPNNFSTTTGKIRIRVQDVNGNIAEDFSDGFFTVHDTSAPPPAPWTIPQAITSVPAPQTIDNVQMATDAAGNLHMVYIATNDNRASPRIITQTVMYTKRSGTTWSTPQTVYSVTQQSNVDPNIYILVNLQLALNNAGLPNLVWGTDYNGGNQSDIFITSLDGGNWSIPFNLSADLPGYVGVATFSARPRIQVDSANVVHVIWIEQSGIYYRKKAPTGIWEPAVNAINTSGIIPGGSPDLSIDSNNTLHLGFLGWVFTSSAVYHASNNGTGWTSPEAVANGVDGYVRIASDSNSHSHMVWYYYNAAASNSEIYYSYFDGVTWSPKELVNSTTTMRQLTISIDSLNRPHVTWEDWGSSQKLLYRYKNGNQWTAPIQLHYDSQIVADHSSVAALSALNNEMHVAWVSTNGASTILYNHANVGSTTDTFAPSVSVVAPVAGTNLSSGSTYAIQWSANDNVSVANVDLHYSADNGVTWTLIAANQPNSGTYSWVVPAATSLQVRVTARDAAGNAGAGFSGSVTTSDTTPPAIVLTAPTSGTPLVGNSSVNVNWTAADNVAVTRIDLDYSLDGGVTWLTMASVLTNSGSYSWLVPNTSTSALLIRAIAQDAVGYTTISAAQLVSIVRANNAPYTPNMPFPLSNGINVPVVSPILEWSSGDIDGDVLTYQVKLGTTSTPPLVGTVSSTAYTTGALLYGTVYYWQIVASDGKTTTVSPVWSFTTQAAPDTQAPTVPVGITTNAISTTQIDLSWIASTDNVGVTNYKVYRNSVLVGSPTATSFSDIGLTAGIVYSYTLAACDAAGNCSAQSAPVLSNTLSIADTQSPLVPTGLAATALSSSRISLHWAVSTDNIAVSGYQVYRDGVLVGSPVGLTYFDNGLKAATSYRYTVSACDASGNCSAQSAAITATTLTGSLAAGEHHSVAIKSDGSLWSWGWNLVGQLGDNTMVSSHKPNPIGTGYVSVATGGRHTAALKADGSVFTWGWNQFGQLGDGTIIDSWIPKQIGTGYTAITAGNGHTVGLKSDGSVWAWGWNSTGQLGDNTTADVHAPKLIDTDYITIAAGYSHNLGLKSDGSLWAWGSNLYGQLGDNTATDSLVPKQIDTGYIAIAAGQHHTVALKADGSLWTWGYNFYGQLGDNTTTESHIPKLIGTGYTAIAAGDYHTLALKSDGTLWAWGINSNGQLGDNSTINSLIPKQVDIGYDSIAAGVSHNLATKPDGSLWTWGLNTYGQLGDNTTIDSHVPKKIGTTSAPAGDLTGNGVVDVADALQGLRIAAGLSTATPADLLLADVAPLVNGKPQPDGKIDIGDVVVLLRRALGLVTW